MCSAISTPQPHHIPGYTGHVAGYKYRLGDTYGSLTHKILLDPTTNHSTKMVLSDKMVADFEVTRPSREVIDIVEGRKKFRDAKFSHPMVPNYAGFVPMSRDKSGMASTIAAEEGVATFEQCQQKKRKAEEELARLVGLQSGKWEPGVEDSQLVKTEFNLPLLEVRPEASGILQQIVRPRAKRAGNGDSQSPYFMEVLNPKKFFIPGFAGHIPFVHSQCGQSFSLESNASLRDFTTNYRRRLSTEWAPVTVVRKDPPLLIRPSEIYHKHIGMLPNYGGHIPGSMYRSGNTFGNDTRDAKRWLRGDFSM
ncbi:UPF0605 protein [Nesidiocoris tenuis]|uniref:UPF0605 protein n=1 Tax=Nesidiocoris tenuis TaxID=355587 RepID=A0ABN7AKX8_9HEMI|nr:UPF0605 protein [Nesidiocoris tenuis]